MIGTIALDMDGVLYDWDGTLRRLAVADLGVEDWGAAKSWEIPFLNEQTHRDWYAANLQRIFMDGQPRPGAIEWSRQLYYLTNRLHIVTSGEPETEVYKKHWLARNDIRYDEFTLVPKGESKTVVPADLYIDDATHVVDDVIANTGAYAILLDAAYNHGVNAPVVYDSGVVTNRLLRAFSWHGIVKLAEFVGYKLDHAAEAG